MHKLVAKNIFSGLDLSPHSSLLTEILHAHNAHIWRPDGAALELPARESVKRVATSPHVLCSLAIWGLGGAIVVDFPYFNSPMKFSPDMRFLYNGEESGYISIYDTVQVQKIGSFLARPAEQVASPEALFHIQTHLQFMHYHQIVPFLQYIMASLSSTQIHEVVTFNPCKSGRFIIRGR